MKQLMLILLFVLSTGIVTGKDPSFRILLFPNGAPSRNGLEETPESINDKGYYVGVSNPELEVFLPDSARATGQIVLVVPGGSYEMVCVTYEGYRTAEWLNGQGIAAAVLKYRMPNGHPDIPLEDGVQAMRVIRREARTWGVDPQNVGVMGFSAGGHFVSMLLTEYPDAESRPDYAVLVYPVITMRYSSVRTRENLLGAHSGDEALRKRYSTCEQVHEGMPEVLLVLCDDDRAVVPENAIRFYRALKRQGVRAEMHIFPQGGHGFWMRERYRYDDETYPLILRWICEHDQTNQTK